MPQKIIILEVNEIPLRVFRLFQRLRPGSNIDRLLGASQVLETLAQDVDPASLYPSQTWASINTGARYSAHRIHWYNDPKPDAYPLYWKLAAKAGVSVGIVNTLHSSPASNYISNDRYKFVIPDCFAHLPDTKPARFKPFHALNVKAVSANARVTCLRAPLWETVFTTLNAPRYGIRFQTLAGCGSLLLQVLRRKLNRERLRNLQFPLTADIFLSLIRKHDPELSILFTNHVAANLHRYWYGLFREDYEEAIYEDAWVQEYSREIHAAMDLLDTYVGELMTLVRQTGRILVMVSSMGQRANQNLTLEYRRTRSRSYRLEDVRRFADRLVETRYRYKVGRAMVPQYPLLFNTVEQARRYAAEVEAAIPQVKGINIECDVNREVVTLSLTVPPGATDPIIRARRYKLSELGFVEFEINDHHSGCHSPEGSLIIHGSSTASAERPQVNYLEYAPALLKHFKVPRPNYMAEPSFSF